MSRRVRVHLLRHGTSKQAIVVATIHNDKKLHAQDYVAFLKLIENKFQLSNKKHALALYHHTHGTLIDSSNWDTILNRDDIKVIVTKATEYYQHVITGDENKESKAGTPATRDSNLSTTEDTTTDTDIITSTSINDDTSYSDEPSDLTTPPPATIPSSHTPFIRLLAQSSIVASEAIQQLNNTAYTLSHITHAVGMPDLHPGRGYPIGTAFASDGWIYPHLIGGDIGCGMSLIQTTLRTDKVTPKRLERWVKKLTGLDDPWNGDTHEWLTRDLSWPPHNGDNSILPLKFDVDKVDVESFKKININLETFNTSLGSIGGGNHFAELQEIDEIVDDTLFKSLQLDSSYLFLLVHSGSRGLGDAILTEHANKHGNKGIDSNGEEAREYLHVHDAACSWAKRNRALIAHRFLSCLGCHQFTCCLDIWHNHVVCKQFCDRTAPSTDSATSTCTSTSTSASTSTSTSTSTTTSTSTDTDTDIKFITSPTKSVRFSDENDITSPSTSPSLPSGPTVPRWLHRKGAAPSDIGPIVIPGSRGAHSYLVLPIGDIESAGYSLAHGAGRKWHRGRAKRAMQERHPNPQTLIKTALDSHVICEDRDLLYEEAPQAYKEITDIIDDLVHLNLIRVIAILKPLITYKMRHRSDRHED